MNTVSIQVPDSIAPLLQSDAFENYTCGSPNQNARDLLNSLTRESVFETRVSDRKLADCCISGLWLLHNFLDESHEISQSIHSSEGSYWHGIMHRLEGDFWNSKYWYRKVGEHPAFGAIAQDFDPYAFVDQCEATHNGRTDKTGEVRATAVTEWIALFEYCYNNATD